MNRDVAQSALALAKAIQDDADEMRRPPPEVVPGRSNAVVPYILVRGTRGYLEKVTHQINQSYENACYDACAVMIRRLIETLIIEAFEAQGIAARIKWPTGDYYQLGDLIDKTLKDLDLSLSRNMRGQLPKLKEVGDKSAHSRYINAVRDDIDKLVPHVRHAVQELLALAHLK